MSLKEDAEEMLYTVHKSGEEVREIEDTQAACPG
jgi:hypothetical protein